MAIELKRGTSISLHPETITKIDGFSEELRGYIGGTERALHEAYSGVSAVHAAMDAAKRDPTLNEAARVVKVDDMARRVFKKVAGMFDAEIVRLEKGIALAEEKLGGPVAAKASHFLASEVRAYVRELPEAERWPFIRAAIRGGDDLTATACLGGPAYLSGLSDAMHDNLLLTYHTHNNPGEAARLKLMRGAKDLIEQRSGLLHVELEKAVGRPPHEVRLMREAKNAADQAFAA